MVRTGFLAAADTILAQRHTPTAAAEKRLPAAENQVPHLKPHGCVGRLVLATDSWGSLRVGWRSLPRRSTPGLSLLAWIYAPGISTLGLGWDG